MVIKNCFHLKYFLQCQLKPYLRNKEQDPPLGQCTPPAGSLLSISPWRAPPVEASYLECTGINALTLDAGQDKEKNGRNLLFIHPPVDI